MSSWPRLVVGTIFLFIAAATGVLAWALETCAGGKAGSMWNGAITFALNTVAWLMLGRRVPSKIVLFVAALPAIAAINYSWSALQLTFGYLANGTGVCGFIMADDTRALDGRELLFITLWLLASVSFWIGLVPVVRRAITVWKEAPSA
jgi:hypothetical protein